jgi:hypothetical protein
MVTRISPKYTSPLETACIGIGIQESVTQTDVNYFDRKMPKIMKDWAANSIAPTPSLRHQMNHHTNDTFSTYTYTVDKMPPLDNWMIP